MAEGWLNVGQGAKIPWQCLCRGISVSAGRYHYATPCGRCETCMQAFATHRGATPFGNPFAERVPLVRPPSPSGGITLVAQRVVAGVHVAPDACSRLLNLLAVGGSPRLAGGPTVRESSAICVGGPPLVPAGGDCSSLRLEEDPAEEESSSEGGGGAGDEEGAWKVTLDQVIPPMEKRETAREAPFWSTCSMDPHEWLNFPSGPLTSAWTRFHWPPEHVHARPVLTNTEHSFFPPAPHMPRPRTPHEKAAWLSIRLYVPLQVTNQTVSRC